MVFSEQTATSKQHISLKTFIQVSQCKEDPPVVVKWSKRDGLGVFATRDVPKGDPLCYYDGIDTNEPSVDPRTFMWSRDWELEWKPSPKEKPQEPQKSQEPQEPQKSQETQETQETQKPQEIQETQETKEPQETQKQYRWRRIGYDSPRTTWGCAQFINDSCKPELGRIHMENQLRVPAEQIKYATLVAECDLYERKTAAAANVFVLPVTVLAHWFFASRNIKKGEELVTSYGRDFWIRWYLTCEEEPIRLSACLLLNPNPFEHGSMGDEELIRLLRGFRFKDAFERFSRTYYDVLATRDNVASPKTTKFQLFTLMVQNLYDFTGITQE